MRRFARATDPGELLVRDWTPAAPGVLPEYEPYLRDRWNSGCTNATLLWQEIRARGCPRRLLRRPRPPRAPAETPPFAPPRNPKPLTVTAWVMTRPDRLDSADQAGVDTILASFPELTRRCRVGADLGLARKPSQRVPFLPVPAGP